MSESAPTIREQRKLETGRRIRRCAMVLTHDRGLDGWTMEDLAEAADVSRRTLFNHVPGKVDAIIGDEPSLPSGAVAAFVAGGPSGDLLDDLGVLADAVLADEDLDRGSVTMRHAVFIANPRLLPIVHERFEKVFADLVDLVLTREGRDFGVRRANLLVKVLVALFDVCVTSTVRDDDTRPIADQYDEALRDLRSLFA